MCIRDRFTSGTDTGYTFDKDTYQNARNFSPDANSRYAQEYRKNNPAKPYVTPTGKSSRASASASVYSVRKGDSLSKIASRNGTTVARLCRLNGLTTSSKLKPGQKIKLR